MAITDLDEQLLVRAHQAGDEHAFGQIVRSQHRALYAHAHRRLGNHEAAEDAVQDTLLRAYRALPSFDGDLRLRAWLHRILTNVCHDEANRRRRQVGLIDKLESQPVELAPDPVDEAVLHDTVRIMSGALAELPDSYREALVLRYVDGLSFREVAEITGVSEENARARVHRGRLALHKVLSRITVLVAFIVPGLRRTQKAFDTGGDSVALAGATEPTVNLSTQLASHFVQAAPVINRVAAEGSSMVAAKSSVVATAVAAVAAVAAPVAAYKVYDTNKAPSRPPAAVAAPATDEPQAAPTTTLTTTVTDAAGSSSTTSVTVATSSTLPGSTLTPTLGEQSDDEETPESTTTTAPTATTTPAPAEEHTTIEGTIRGDGFSVTGERPDFEVNGSAVLRGSGDPSTGTLSGRIYVADTVGDEAIAELTYVLDDGRQMRVRFRGTLDSEQTGDGVTIWTMSGQYSIHNAEWVGLADTGTAGAVFSRHDGAPSSISFDLRGEQSSDD